MEKIIAVVVMIAIVVGLIASSVIPMVNQMQAQGETASQDITQLTAGLQDGQALGSSVIQDFQINMSNIIAGSVEFTVNGTKCTTLAAARTAITSDKNVYSKAITRNPDGSIATLTYTLVSMN